MPKRYLFAFSQAPACLWWQEMDRQAQDMVRIGLLNADGGNCHSSADSPFWESAE